jgi:hypothetical protein
MSLTVINNKLKGEFILFLLSIFVLFSADLYASNKILIPLRSSSSPDIMNKDFEKKFSKLPLEGVVSSGRKFWSSDYWALFKGGINYRWNSASPTGFDLNSPSFQEALQMSQEDLKQLAPSEKFDLLLGNYNYPLKTEVGKRATRNRREWEGICHGWAMAALNHSEPIPRVLSNPNGLLIPFGSSDIKALLSYYYAYKYDPESTHQMGKRCRGNRNCYKEDMNAGAFHIVLANLVGLEGDSFIADIERKHEVWNQVVKDYKSEILSSSEKAIIIKTTVRYVFNIKENSWLPANETPNQTFKEIVYEYSLELNRDGRIVGGTWISKDRPDFLWKVSKEDNFKGPFQSLKRLLIDDPSK